MWMLIRVQLATCDNATSDASAGGSEKSDEFGDSLEDFAPIIAGGVIGCLLISMYALRCYCESRKPVQGPRRPPR